MKNIFTVDLEDCYFVPENESICNIKKIPEYRINLHKNVDCILSILRNKNFSATFFVLGKLAESEPELIQKINSQGHEIACHGYDHTNPDKMSCDEFKYDLELSINAIYKASNKLPTGYRAPNFAINKNNIWTLSILKEFGFAYDSSIYPLKYYSEYKRNEIVMDPFIHESGIIEIPLSCIEMLQCRIPFSGGAYFRFIPYKIYRNFIKKLNKRNRELVFYIHPWELNNSLPKNSVKSLSKIRKFHNINKVGARLKSLTDDFEFCSVEEFIRSKDLIKRK